jgi:predicted nucleotide-binding protein
MLAKVFGPNPGFIDAVLYASEQQVYSMYEPESKLEKQRRKIFQASLRMLEICLEEFSSNKDSSKSEINEKIKNRVASERKAFMAQNQEEGKKELGLSKEPSKTNIVKGKEKEMVPEIRETLTIQGPDEAQKGPESTKGPSNPELSKGVEVAASENGGVPTVQGDDEGKKHPEVNQESPNSDTTEEIEDTEASDGGKDSITPGFEEEKKAVEPIAEAFKPDIDKRMESMKTSEGRKVFIVHGNDEEKKEAVATLLAKMDLEPVILHEQPGHAMALIEKFEHYGDVVFAIIILTGDDYGYGKGKPEESKPRPRQNVVFELGFLIGRFQGQHVCALHEEGLEMPSDYKGAVFIPYDAGGIWKLLVARAMKTANLNVDLNKAI